MKKLLILLSMLLLLCPFVLADGMAHFYVDDKDMWNLLDENQQLAAINYQDGFENMLLSIDINDQVHGAKAVWIFPIPASPDDVVIDILKGFPVLRGTDLDRKYDDTVGMTGAFMAGYAVFPISWFILPFSYLSPGAKMGDTLAARGAEDNVVVHETVTKMGLTSELVTTKSPDSLAQYLQDKGLNLPKESNDMLNEYVGKDYSFVISYISDLQELKNQKVYEDYVSPGRGIPIGVFVKFPTDKIYFPLKPTSVYGSQEIPILVYVMGHVNPALYKEIKPLTETTYFTYDGWYQPNEELSPFFNGEKSINNLKYTKIKITAPSKYFSEDLWIKNSAPVSVWLKNLLIISVWGWAILLFVAFSMIASLFAGIISFRNNPVPRKQLMLQGSWNCLTFLGFVLARHKLDTKEIDIKKEVDPRLLQNLREKGLDITVRYRNKGLYIFLFYVFFLVFTFTAVQILMTIL